MISEWKNLTSTQWIPVWKQKFKTQQNAHSSVQPSNTIDETNESSNNSNIKVNTEVVVSTMVLCGSTEKSKQFEILDIITRMLLMNNKSCNKPSIVCVPAYLPSDSTNRFNQLKQPIDQTQSCYVDWEKWEKKITPDEVLNNAFDKLRLSKLVHRRNDTWYFDHLYYNSLVIRFAKHYRNLSPDIWKTMINDEELIVKTVKTKVNNDSSDTTSSNSDYSDWFKLSLLPLSALGWPTESKEFNDYFPYSFYAIDDTNEDAVKTLQQMLVLVYALVGKFAFNELHTYSRKQNQLLTSQFNNKMWNLAKFILQLPHFRKNKSEAMKVDAPVAEAKSKKRINVHSKHFLLSAKSEFTDPPKTPIPRIMVHEGQKPVSSKWKSSRKTSKAGNNNPLLMKEKLRTFRGCLNKITPTNIDKLVPKLVPLFTMDIFDKVVELVYSKIVMEPELQEMYAQLCQEFKTEHPTFTSAFYIKCKEEIKKEFETTYTSEVLKHKARKKFIGTVKFVGHLVNKNVLPKSVCLPLFQLFFDKTDSEYSIELVCVFAKTLECRDELFPLEFDELLKEYISKQDCGMRLKFMVQDTLDLFKKDRMNYQKIQSLHPPEDPEDQKDARSLYTVKFNGEVYRFHFCSNYWIMECLIDTIRKTTHEYSKHQYANMTDLLYAFFYEYFCDIYLEAVKPILYQTTEDIRHKETVKTLMIVLKTSLVLLHPFLPLLTEEFYYHLSQPDGKTPTDSLLDQPYPTLSLSASSSPPSSRPLSSSHSSSLSLSPSAPLSSTPPSIIGNSVISEFKEVNDQLIEEVKKERLLFKLGRKQTMTIIIVCKDDVVAERYKKFYDMIRALCWCKEITITTDTKIPFAHKKYTTTCMPNLTVYYDWNSIDRKQLNRLKSKYEKYSFEYKRISAITKELKDNTNSNSNRSKNTHRTNNTKTTKSAKNSNGNGRRNDRNQSKSSNTSGNSSNNNTARTYRSSSKRSPRKNSQNSSRRSNSSTRAPNNQRTYRPTTSNDPNRSNGVYRPATTSNVTGTYTPSSNSSGSNNTYRSSRSPHRPHNPRGPQSGSSTRNNKPTTKPNKKNDNTRHKQPNQNSQGTRGTQSKYNTNRCGTNKSDNERRFGRNTGTNI